MGLYCNLIKKNKKHLSKAAKSRNDDKLKKKNRVTSVTIKREQLTIDPVAMS